MIPQNQRSPEWKKWRQSRVGASDCAIILGANSFKSIGQLFDEKLGIRPPDEENAAMARGNALEDDARLAFEEETGHVVFAQVCIHPEHNWMIASMDGMTIEKDVAVEIKCPGYKVAMETFVSRKVPSYYFPQLQHQMAVTGLNEIYYYSYYPEENLTTCLIVARDQDYIDKLIKKEHEFYKILTAAIQHLELSACIMDEFKDGLYKILNEGN